MILKSFSPPIFFLSLSNEPESHVAEKSKTNSQAFSVSYLLLHSKLLQTLQLWTTNIYHLTDSVGQECRSALARWFWLRISHEVSVMLAGTALSTSKLTCVAAGDGLNFPHVGLATGL